MEIIRREIFGPVVPIVTFDDLDEAIAYANDSDYGLTSSIYTRDLDVAMRACQEIKFGETYINRENFEAMQGFHAGWRKSRHRRRRRQARPLREHPHPHGLRPVRHVSWQQVAPDQSRQLNPGRRVGAGRGSRSGRVVGRGLSRSRSAGDQQAHTMTRAQLFVSCMVDMFRPRAGIAAVHVLERRGVAVEFPSGQTCCGQFAYNAGHHCEAAAMGRQFVRAFERTGADGSPADPPPVIALSGSCAAMVKVEMPELLERDALARGRTPASAARSRQRAEALAGRVVELSEWLDAHDAPGPSDAATAAATEQGATASLKVACHTGCHMRRLLGLTEPPLRALRRAGVEPVELTDADQCCGFGGSFGLIEPDISAAMTDAKLAHLATARSEGATCLVSADLGCLMQLGGRLSRHGDEFPTLHLAELVDLADQDRLTVAEIGRAARSQGADA